MSQSVQAGGIDAHAAAMPAGVSPNLYNQDLAPSKKAGRTWTAYNIFALWANDVHKKAVGCGLPRP